MAKRRQFLRGQELLDALDKMASHTKSAVKWIVGEQSYRIPPGQAVCIVKASDYEGKFHNGRVFFIREIITRPAPVSDPSFWDGRATLRWMKPVDKRTVAIWDKFFAQHSSVIQPSVPSPAQNQTPIS